MQRPGNQNRRRKSQQPPIDSLNQPCRLDKFHEQKAHALVIAAWAQKPVSLAAHRQRNPGWSVDDRVKHQIDDQCDARADRQAPADRGRRGL